MEPILGLPVDLNYCSFYLPVGWVAQVNLEKDFIALDLIHAQAKCEISLLSAGLDRPSEVFFDLYNKLVTRAQGTGRTVIDLEEDFDFEFISELDPESNSLGFQHTFLRLCGNVIILANLIGHSAGDDDKIRQMLANFQPKSSLTSEGTLTRLPRGNLFNEWDRIGMIAVTYGTPLL